MTMTTIRCTAAIAAGLAALTLGGCAGTQSLSGKVIDGRAGVVAIVTAEDARLSGPGLAGAAVQVRAIRGAGEARPIGEAITGPDGVFSLSAAGLHAFRDKLEFIVEAPGFDSARGAVSIPGESGRVLVVMRRRPDSPRRPD